jgi:eukaryotic-like serine/threonine-protein kinase
MATTDNGNRERAIFEAALDIASAEGRLGYLKGACGEDAALLARVQALLRAHEAPEGFLPEQPRDGATVSLVTEKPGDKIGHYKLLEQIGEGGCGVVYMAEQTEPIRRRVALKVIKLGMDTKHVIARFEAERQALALMDHPNIAKVLDAGATETGRPYFVMELVRGVKITDYCDENRLSTEERLNLFVQVCHAIQHAHQKGIIHRDIKPSNILVTLNDGVRVPKVIDFGIAKAIGQQLTDKTVFTAFEQLIGTPAYMSPEQAVMTSLDIDTRSDIYALGVLLYELLTGHTPFDQKELVAAGLEEMRRIIHEQEPARPSTRLSTLADPEQTTVAKRRHSEPPQLIHLVRGDLDWIVMKCLEKDRTRRYETANGLADDVMRHLEDEPVVARPPGRVYRLQKLIRRNKLVFAAGAAVVGALLVGLGLSTWLFFKEQAARRRAVNAEKTQGQLRQQAQAEARKSEQVAQFLKDMLQGVGPSVALGRDTTMLKEILDKTAERVGKDLKGQPEVEIELRNAIGAVYSELGQTGKAEEMHRRALELARRLPGKRRLEVASSLDGLALTTSTNLAASEVMEREALAIRWELLGEQHPDVATSLNHLGILLKRQGKMEESEAVQRQALTLRKQILGEQSSEVADALNDLGEVSLELGRPETESMHREALDMARITHGNEHPAVAVQLSDLALVLDYQGRLAEAEPLHRECLDIRRKVLGDNHPAVPLSVGRLADSLWCQGKVAEAEGLYREAVDKSKAIYGPQHRIVASSANRLVVLFRQEGKVAEADHQGQETAELESRLSDDDLIVLAFGLRNQGIRLQVGGRSADAEALGRHAVELLRGTRRSERRDHVLSLSLATLGSVLRSQGRSVEARPLYREALVLESALPPSKVHRLSLVGRFIDLASLATERGDPAEAESLYREGIAILKKERDDPAGNADLPKLYAGLGDSLRHQGKPAEAEAAYRDGLVICRQVSTNDFQALVWLAGGVAGILKNQGKLAEAETMYRETVDAGRKSNEPHALAGALASLGDMLRDQGKAVQAELVYREGLDLCRKVAPNAYEQRQWLAGGLGLSLRSQGKLAEAEAAYREAVTNAAKVWPDDPARWQWQVNDLADVLRSLGKSAEAEKLAAHVLPSTPQTRSERIGSLRTQANLSGRHGQWEDAAANLTKLLEMEPAGAYAQLQLAVVLVETGDLKAYRAHCERMLARFGGTNDAVIADQTAKACLLVPGSVPNLESASQLVDKAVTLGKDHAWFSYFQMDKGLAEYRRGQYASAVDWMRKVIGQPMNVGSPLPAWQRDTAAYSVLAMAQHQLKQTDEARAALAKASELARTKLPQRGSDNLEQDWVDWLIAHVLLREAKALVNGEPGATAQP